MGSNMWIGKSVIGESIDLHSLTSAYDILSVLRMTANERCLSVVLMAITFSRASHNIGHSSTTFTSASSDGCIWKPSLKTSSAVFSIRATIRCIDPPADM